MAELVYGRVTRKLYICVCFHYCLQISLIILMYEYLSDFVYLCGVLIEIFNRIV